jgi:hypothetical protein
VTTSSPSRLTGIQFRQKYVIYYHMAMFECFMRFPFSCRMALRSLYGAAAGGIVAAKLH